MPYYDFLSIKKYKEVISMHKNFTGFGIVFMIPFLLCCLVFWHTFRTISRSVRMIIASFFTLLVVPFFWIWFATVKDKEGETYFSVFSNIFKSMYEVPDELEKY